MKKKQLAEAVAARLQGKKTVAELQAILDEAGAQHMTVIDIDTIQVQVDDEPEFFRRWDEMQGHPMSGIAYFGSCFGDHRMIRQIHDDIKAAFELLK